MKGEPPDKPSRSGADLDGEALDWLVRLRSGRAEAADRTAFAAWRRRSPAHEAAADAAERLWREIGETPTATRRATEANARSRPALNRRMDRRPIMARRAVLTGAAAAAAVFVVVAPDALGPISALLADHATALGERRQVRLPDGSIAMLNTDSSISSTYSAAERRLVLHKGEAFFRVAREPRRPFVVAAGGGEVRALGTAFAVRHDGRTVLVTVTEGTVEVASKAREAAGVRLSAGQQTAFGADGIARAPRPADAEAATAWTRGKLVFNKRPLADVVAELERYRAGRILVLDETLRQSLVSGVFDLDDPDGALRTLADILQVEIVELPFIAVIR